jgi:hypothetical protein
MTDVTINVTAHELDPTKKYVVEIRRGDLGLEASEGLAKQLQRLGVVGIVVITETGEAIKVKEVPDNAK